MQHEGVLVRRLRDGLEENASTAPGPNTTQTVDPPNQTYPSSSPWAPLSDAYV